MAGMSEIDPTLAAIAEQDFDFLLPQLTERQPEVLEAESYYLQMLAQPTPLPAEGETGTPDPEETRPSDRADTPVQTSVWEVRAHCVMVDGRTVCMENGWSVYQEVISGGSKWSRQIIVEGPGESRPWTIEVAPPIAV